MVNIIASVPISTGQRIKDLIKESGMTQVQFAEKFSVDTKTVSAWVNNKYRITKAHLSEIAAFFDVDVAYLACKQVEKRHSENVWSEYDKQFKSLSDEVQRIELWESCLKAMGYTFEMLPVNGDCEMEQFSEIVDGKLIRFEAPVQSVTEYSIRITSPDKTTKEVSEQAWEHLQKDTAEYLSFKLNQL